MIKRARAIALTFAFALASPWNTAWAEDNNAHYYAGVQAGWHDLDRWSGDVHFGAGVSVPGHVTLDQNGQGGLIVGRERGPVRYEVEYQRGAFDLQSIHLGPQSQAAGGGGHYEALTLNAYRAAPIRGAVSAYLGAGIGYGRVEMPGARFNAGCNCFAPASGKGLTWQLRVGLEYGADSPHKAFVQYTLLSLPGADSGGVPSVDYGRERIGIVGLGYRYAFK